MKRLTRLFILTAGPVGVGQLAVAKYVPPRFYDLAGQSAVVVLGEVVKVDSKTFTLRPDEVLAGSAVVVPLVIVRFQDWTCSHRWKPYAAGQHEVAFLDELPPDQARPTGARYRLRSAGDEAEWEIRGDQVSVQGFRVPGGVVYDEGEHPGQWLPLHAVLDALRTYRHCFSVSPAPSGDWWKHKVRVLCEGQAIEAFRGRSVVHEYLTKTSLEASRD